MDDNSIEHKGLEHLEKIESELKEIKLQQKGSRWQSLRNGLWQGAGAIIGGVAAVIVLGWILSFLGVIPGFGEMAHYIQQAFQQSRYR